MEPYFACILMWVNICSGIQHTVVTAGWGYPYTWNGQCQFDVPTGVTSWTVNITFDKDVSTFNPYEAIVLSDGGDWKCVKNQNDLPATPYTATLGFQGVYTVAPEPVGGCYILLDGIDSCISGTETTDSTTNTITSTTTQSVTANTANQSVTTSMTTLSVTSTTPSSTVSTLSPTSCTSLPVSTTPRNLCACNSTVTAEEFAAIIAFLTVDKSTVSATIRKKTSANDDRPTSKGMGSVGIIVIVGVCGLVVASDILGIHHKPSVKVPKKKRQPSTQETDVSKNEASDIITQEEGDVNLHDAGATNTQEIGDYVNQRLGDVSIQDLDTSSKELGCVSIQDLDVNAEELDGVATNELNKISSQ